MDITYRWINGPDLTQSQWDQLEEICAARGWMSLNRNVPLRVLLAEQEGGLVGFHIFQWLPYCGPLFVRPSARGTGVADELAEQMFEFLKDARGWVVTAESPHAVALCEKYNMHPVGMPVYVMGDPGGVDV